MKAWHLVALGVAALAVARAVNIYRGTHYRQDVGADGTRRPSWLEGLGGVVGVYHFPSVVSAAGPISLVSAATPAPTTSGTNGMIANIGGGAPTYGPGGIFTNPNVR